MIALHPTRWMAALAALCVLASGAGLALQMRAPDVAWNTPLDPRLTRMRDDVHHCLLRLDALEYTERGAVLLAPTSSAGAASAGGMDRARLQTLERRLDQVRSDMGLGPARLLDGAQGLQMVDVDPVDLFHSVRHQLQRAEDRSLDPPSRVRALRALHSLGDPGAIHAALADEMLAVARLSSDPEVRRNILWGLNQRDFPEVTAAALDFLSYDPSRTVREEAVDLLAPRQSSRPAVRHALERARASDPSPQVRKRAQKALERYP